MLRSLSYQFDEDIRFTFVLIILPEYLVSAYMENVKKVGLSQIPTYPNSLCYFPFFYLVAFCQKTHHDPSPCSPITTMKKG